MGSVIDRRRVRCLKEESPGDGPVVYWMSRDQRVSDNWALIYAQELALLQKKPLLVVFCLVQNFLNATLRQYRFMIEGLEQVDRVLLEKDVCFVLLSGTPEQEIPTFVRKNRVSIVVSDFDPLRVKREWKEKVVRTLGISFYEVDARNIVPCWIVSAKQEYGAYTIRPKIHRLLGEFLTDFPPLSRHPYSWNTPVKKIFWEEELHALNIGKSIKPVEWLKSGEGHAREVLDDFLRRKIGRYHHERNDPVKDAVSNLSPYLHFGQIAAQRIALEVRKTEENQQGKKDFLEELVVRRELSDNFCYYNQFYDTTACFPQWAQQTLAAHRNDRREYIYDCAQLEQAKTHDPLWNATQTEMVVRGKLHGYLRMYWAKKILEWTPNIEEAMRIAIYLNDRYELDGRDSNGYTGICWALGGVHDRAWFERPIFGKIRYMSYRGSASKFDVPAYIQRTHALTKS